MEAFTLEVARAVVLTLAAALGLAFAGGLALKLFDALSKNLSEMEELKRGNAAVGCILAAVIIALGLVMGLAVKE